MLIPSKSPSPISSFITAGPRLSARGRQPSAPRWAVAHVLVTSAAGESAGLGRGPGRGQGRRRERADRPAGSARSRTARSPRPGRSPRPSPDPSRRARRPCPAPRPLADGPGRSGLVGARLGASSSLRSSPNRSSWIQSASPETPTPSRRTPPEVSSSASRLRASRAIGGARRRSGEGRVAERLSVVKSCSRTLIVTVRPDMPFLRSRSRDAAGLPREQPLHQLAVGQVGVVGALDADRLGLALGHHRPVVLGPGERRAARAPWALPSIRTSSLDAQRLEVGDGVDADPAQPLGGGRPDAGDHRHVHRPEQVRSVPGGTTTSPSGLSRSLATLAMNFEVADAHRRRSARPSPRCTRGPQLARRTRGPSPPRGRGGRPGRGRRRPRRATAARPGGRRSRSSAITALLASR